MAGGSAPQLAAALEPVLGYRPSDKTVRSWVRGDRQPDSYVLVAAVIALHDRGLSLDRYAVGEDVDSRPIQEQIDELRKVVLALKAALDDDLARRGRPPVEVA